MFKGIKFYKQYDSTDCGPTCLKIITRFYGKKFSLQFLREESYIGKDGVSLLSIKSLAEKVGFEALAIKGNIEVLNHHVAMPCILHWNQNHFVVLYKIKKDWLTGKLKFYIADPDHGKVILNEDLFSQAWLSTEDKKGIALQLKPNSKFDFIPEVFEGKKGFSFLLEYIHPNKRHLWGLIFFTFIAGFISLVFPFIAQQVMDKGILPKNIPLITMLLFAQLALLFGQAIAQLIRNWLLLKINTEISISLISDFLVKLTRLPIRFFDSKSVGDINQRIADHDRIEHFLTQNLVSTLFGIINFIIFSCILIYYDIQFFIIFLIGSAASIFWIVSFLNKRKDIDYRKFQVQQQNQDILFEIITGMSEIKLNNAEKSKIQNWKEIQRKLYKINLKGLNYEQWQEIGAFTFTQSKNILLTYLAAKQVVQDEITLGVMMSISYIIGQMNAPLEQLISFFKQGQDAKISLNRMSEIHNSRDEDQKTEVTIPVKNEIRLENVYFQYEGEYSPYILKDISLTIPHGKVTAIVGSSGSGKTTLLKLLLKFYLPTKGNLFLGDTNFKEFSAFNWRDYCGTVMQEGFVFSDSIEKNIALSDKIIDYDKLKLASQLANIYDYISTLPLGFKTTIGGSGLGISIGQKQRILIARAIYKNPSFILFDEATSALDARNENEISKNLKKFFANRTVVIVAHRLSTVKDADQIVVLDSGEIVEIGSHKELIDKRGFYFELVKNQLELGS